METLLPAAEVYRRVTEGLLTRLSTAFPEWDVAIALAGLPTTTQEPTGNGIVRITPLAWEHTNAKDSRTNGGMELFYAVYIGLPLAGTGWEHVSEASQAPFRIYDALKGPGLPNCPAVHLSSIKDKTFVDFDKVEQEQLFYSVLQVCFLARNLK